MSRSKTREGVGLDSLYKALGKGQAADLQRELHILSEKGYLRAEDRRQTDSVRWTTDLEYYYLWFDSGTLVTFDLHTERTSITVSAPAEVRRLLRKKHIAYVLDDVREYCADVSLDDFDPWWISWFQLFSDDDIILVDWNNNGYGYYSNGATTHLLDQMRQVAVLPVYSQLRL